MSAWIIYLLYAILNIYVIFQILYWASKIRPGRTGPKIIAGVFMIIMSIIPVLAVVWKQEGLFKNHLQTFANIWLGFFLIFGAVLFIFHMCRLIVGRHSRKDVSPKRAALSLCICAAISICLNGFGTNTAQHVTVNNFSVDLTDKNFPAHGSVRIVLIADLHLGVNSSITQLQDMVDLINDQDADMVLVAGDIFNSTYDGLKDPDRQAEILASMKSKYGTYGVYGNHDVVEPLLYGFALTPPSEAYRSADMVAFTKKAGFTMLEDNSVTVDGLQIIGRKDREKTGDGLNTRESTSDVLASASSDKPVIVLQHEPKDFEDMSKAGADLALCGHTHDGQIFPGNILVSLMYENSCGQKTVSGMETIVTSGVGYYGPPLRLGTKSEIAVIDLTY
jgi:predicted MPP superfamily phosphohydrolase